MVRDRMAAMIRFRTQIQSDVRNIAPGKSKDRSKIIRGNHSADASKTGQQVDTTLRPNPSLDSTSSCGIADEAYWFIDTRSAECDSGRHQRLDGERPHGSNDTISYPISIRSSKYCSWKIQPASTLSIAMGKSKSAISKYDILSPPSGPDRIHKCLLSAVKPDYSTHK